MANRKLLPFEAKLFEKSPGKVLVRVLGECLEGWGGEERGLESCA
ncbi:hypothetical protein [Bartonella doshiae]|nr:hypothetical protein [Bartonella doshiae]MBB6158933.1 hypothetical protein [Bartonella doshiae]